MQEIYKQVERIRIVLEKEELLSVYTNLFSKIMQLSYIYII